MYGCPGSLADRPWRCIPISHLECKPPTGKTHIADQPDSEGIRYRGEITWTDPSASPMKIPLRLLLIVPFMLEIAAAVGLTGWLSLRNGQRAVNDVVAQLEQEVTHRTQETLHQYLATPHRINQINQELFAQALLTFERREQFDRHFWHQIQEFEQASYIYVSSETGGFWTAHRVSASGPITY
jgi:hypothetical protein